MASAWQPNEEGVRRITTLLQEYLQPGADQARLFQELEQCKQFPDFNNYLAFVLCLGQDYNVQVRQSAGLLLKNNLRGWESTAPEFRSYMRDSLLQCVRCSERMLRQTAGTVISTIVHLCGSKDFLQLFALFLSADAQNEADALDGYLDTIFKIGEEASYRLAETVDGMPQSPADAIVPRLLQLMASPHPNQRKKALGSLNYLLYCMPKSLFDRLDAFLQGLFSLSTDPNNDIRKLVSSGLVQMLELSPQSLQPHIHQVMEYMLNASQDGDQDVALESSEFWSAFCQNQLPAQLLWEYVPRLVPVLLKNMVYDDDDEAVINAQAEEEGLLQSTASDQDLKPFIPQGKNKGGEAEGEEEDDDFIAVWNLRKSSAAGLDILSNTFGKELLPALLPPVQQNLNSTDWKVRESAVLTIGAIAEGCYDGLVPHLGGLIPFLVPMLEDQRPLVRSITCWSISRYTAWLVSDGKQVLDGVVDGLMKRTLDRNKTVQEAACSALATITEEAGSLMTPHVNSIVQCLIVALTNYGKRSLRNLYDALGTLAESVGDTLGTQQYMNAILPPLFAKWTELGELDRELLPLLACVTSMVPAFARHIAVFAEGLYTQCLKILSVHLQLQQGNDPRFDRDFVISALDLLGSLGEALGSSMEGLVKEGQLREMLVMACQDQDYDVRQSGFALLGDLAKTSHVHLLSRVGALLQLCMANLDPAALQRRETIPACNNACWAMGELAVKLHDQMQQHVNVLEATAKVATLLNSKEVSASKSLIENCAITLGRVAIANAEVIAPHSQAFMFAWCSALSCIRDDIEKEHAFMGLCSIIQKNPQACVGDPMVPLCRAMASWHSVQKEELLAAMRWVMQMYKQQLGQQWVQMFEALEPSMKSKLVAMYELS